MIPICRTTQAALPETFMHSRAGASLSNAMSWLLSIALILLVLAAWVTFVEPIATPAILKAEWVKSLLQLAVIVLGGAMLKAVLDESHASRRRAEAIEDQNREHKKELAEFRQDRLKRLVGSNNRLRQARILLRAYGSARSYRDQFL